MYCLDNLTRRTADPPGHGRKRPLAHLQRPLHLPKNLFFQFRQHHISLPICLFADSTVKLYELPTQNRTKPHRIKPKKFIGIIIFGDIIALNELI
jgi:hypothetical protein